jgi:hypothetical protein
MIKGVAGDLPTSSFGYRARSPGLRLRLSFSWKDAGVSAGSLDRWQILRQSSPQSLPAFVKHAVTRPERPPFDLVFHHPQGSLATPADRVGGINIPLLEHSLSPFVPAIAEMLSAPSGVCLGVILVWFWCPWYSPFGIVRLGIVCLWYWRPHPGHETHGPVTRDRC